MKTTPDFYQWIPAVVTALISLIGILWVQRKADHRASEAQRIQLNQFDITEARARETQRLQAEQFEKADARARDAQRLQSEQLEKAVRVERHTQAYQRWHLLIWFERKNQDGEAWAKFMNEMREWQIANRLYLTDGAAKAFSEALNARTTMDVIGDHPAVDHHRAELYQTLQAAGDLILANSPRYGS